jgi:hypothetical protein
MSIAAGWRIKLLYHIFDDFDRFAQDYGINYWLEGGSVIGAARHKGIIPHDDDIDLQVDPKEYRRLRKMGPELKKYNLALTYVKKYGTLMKIVRPGGASMGKGKPYSFPFIDVFRMRKTKDEKGYEYDSAKWREDLGGGEITFDELYPIRRVPFGAYEASVPNKMIPYLKKNYGDDVMTTAYFAGLHAGEYDKSLIGKLDLKVFEAARPFYYRPGHSRRTRSKSRRMRSKSRRTRSKSRRARSKSRRTRSKSRRTRSKSRRTRSKSRRK